MGEETTLRLYNTLTRQKEVFTPLDPANVRMYACGPTVYDYAHIGNGRMAIVFDLLFRVLRHTYGDDHVTYVRNITDVDDKINARALRDHPDLPLNEAIRKVTETTAAQYQKDVTALGCLAPTVQPRATDNIDGMVKMISRLIDNGNAYEAGGEVLFAVESMPDYGKLSGRNLEDNLAGARIAVETHKRNPADFVLWKLSADDEPGWDSPWGRGRPGWHLECSAMSERYLGEIFDIHGGGLDLIFPHHENEIAQSRCAHGTPTMANVWMHNGFLQVEGQKMSKSLGNFFTIAQLLETEDFGGRKWPGEVLRLAMLMTHYREPIDFTQRRLEEASVIYRSFAEVVRDYVADPMIDEVVLEAVADDLNTPLAVQRLVSLRREALAGDVGAGRRLTGSLRLLGFFGASFIVRLSVHYRDANDMSHVAPEEFVEDNSHLALDAPVDVLRAKLEAAHPEAKLILGVLRRVWPTATWSDLRSLKFGWLKEQTDARLDALNARDFATADKIRADLFAEGIQLMDYKDETGARQTRWEVKR